MWNWTSGAASPSRVRTNPPPSPPLDVHGPRPSASYWREGLRRGGCDQAALVGEDHEVEHQVVLQVLADRQLVAGLDPQRREPLAGPDAREHQELRRVVGARREHDLALGADLLERAAAHDLDADRAIGLEEDPVGAGVGHHVDVAARDRWMQIGDRGAAAPPVALGELEAPGALLGGAVEVLVVRDADLAGGLDPGLDDRVHRAALADAERAADPVVVARAALVVLGALEVGQDVLVAPAFEAHRRPLVVVGAVAADVDHRVERARAAEHAAARQVVAPVVEPRLGLTEQRPVPVARQVRAEGERHVDLGGVVGRARLDHRHLDVRILAQAIGHHAAGRAGADDHVVVHARTVRLRRRRGPARRARVAP